MLNKGDIVILTNEGLIEFGKSNKLNKGNVGKIVAVSGEKGRLSFNYYIRWDTGHGNRYRNCDVQLLEEENE
ncbi:MAG: hypothetical protein ACRCVU_13870 [Flavobacterium sp.]